jgi:Tfp pilus assembly protein PilX
MYNQQTGSTLAISLVLLAAITLVSITSLQRTDLQTRIVANSQHSEAAFHAANSDLEEMFAAYVNDTVSSAALSDSIDQFVISSGVKTYTKTRATGVTSSYQTNAQGNSHLPQLASTIVHTGQSPFSSGNSQGSFATYQFQATTTANEPNNGRILSSQSIGLEFIGPALN